MTKEELSKIKSSITGEKEVIINVHINRFLLREFCKETLDKLGFKKSSTGYWNLINVVESLFTISESDYEDEYEYYLIKSLGGMMAIYNRVAENIKSIVKPENDKKLMKGGSIERNIRSAKSNAKFDCNSDLYIKLFGNLQEDELTNNEIIMSLYSYIRKYFVYEYIIDKITKDK